MGKKIGLFLFLISLAMIGAGLYLYYFNPRKVMLETLGNEISNIKIKNISQKLKVTSELTGSYSNEYKFENNATVALDQDILKMYFSEVLKINDKTYLDPEIYLENNKVFFNIKELSEKLGYIELTDNSEAIKIPKKEMDALLNAIKAAVVENLPEERFSGKSETIVINKNSFKTRKYSVSVQAEDLYNIFVAIFKSIYGEKSMPTIKSIIFTTDKYDKVHLNSDTFESDLKREIIGDKSENKVLFTYSIYLIKNKELLKQELSYKTGEEGKESKIKLTYAKIDESATQKDYEFVIQKDNKNILETTIVKSGETSNVSATLQESKITVTGEIKKVGVERTIDLSVQDFDKNSAGTITGNYKEVKPSEEYNFTLNANMTLNGKAFNLTMKNSIYMNQDVQKMDTTGAEKYKGTSLKDVIKAKINEFKDISSLIDISKCSAAKASALTVLNNVLTCSATKTGDEVCTLDEIKKYDLGQVLDYNISISKKDSEVIINTFKITFNGYTFDIKGGEKCTITNAKAKINSFSPSGSSKTFEIKCDQ